MTEGLVAGIDQGTTGTTVLLVDSDGAVAGRGYAEIPQSYPSPGWVEHDPDALYDSVVKALAAAQGKDARPVVAVGLTNQRETTVVWDRRTGRAIAPAIVWQDRRTADVCQELRAAGHEPRVQRTTGLVLDPYFSATKLAWLLDHTPGARGRAEAGELAFGTVDSWIIHRLSGGAAHVTDASNASRTLLYDLHTGAWSDEMCALFRVPRAVLPAILTSSGAVATCRGVAGIADGTSVAGIAGDQQAALYGQRCLAPGDAKCTFGTGSFLLMNVGSEPVSSRRKLLTSVAWTLDGRRSFVLEGSAFVCGALVQWLRDGLGIIEKASDVEALARQVPDSGGVVIVPALAGLGAPHWRPEARGLITGLSRGTTKAHIARAALEAMALQNVELVAAMESDAARPMTALRVDGGATANDLLMQLQADLLGAPILRPSFAELTAMGAAGLAARGIGWPGFDQGVTDGAPDEGVTRFEPTMPPAARAAALSRFREAVARA